MDQLRSGITLVTGATGTIGQAIVKRLAFAGLNVIASGRSEVKLAELQREGLGEGHPLAGTVVIDAMSDDSVRQAVEKVASQHGSILGLVNCMAVPRFGDFLHLSDEDWETVLQVKLLGYMRTMRAVLPYMMKQGSGSIVNISGRGGRQPTPAHLPGCCANIAVITLTKGLSNIYAAHGIRINVVSPGPIESPRHRDIEAINREVTGISRKMPPMQRFGQPNDVANAVLFLLSPRAAFITGTNLAVDGGSTAAI